MTIHEAAEILRHPEKHWSHHRDEAKDVAIKLLFEIDSMMERMNPIDDIFDKYPSTVEHITGTSPV